jgi:hypothetical protein
MEKKTRTRLWRVMLVLVVITAVGPCAVTHKFGPYYGIVLDQETGQPIEGAGVHVSFHTEMITLAGDVSKYVNAMETLTDKNGEFYIGSYRALLFRFPQVWDNNCIVKIFKPGYGAYPNNIRIKYRYEPAYSIPSNKYLIIKLPKLVTLDELKRNLSSAMPIGIPMNTQSKMRELEKIERKNLGYKD